MGETIDTDEAVARALGELAAGDETIAAILAQTGQPPLRRRSSGFEGLAQVVVSQQVSVASARAIWGRTLAAVSPFEAERVRGLDDEVFRGAGLSRPKIRTLRAVAEALVSGELDLAALPAADAEAAGQALCAVKGIGPWTADIYLLFCHGHPDVWPAGDLALQYAVGVALGLEARPDRARMMHIGERWRPWRSAAARLFWSYYALVKGRGGIAV